MPKVYTEFNRPKTIPTNPGDQFLNEYQEAISKDGSKELIITGKKNIYEMIQADLESTKIENILHAVAMGDLQALNAREAFYVDATTMPKTLMEAQNLVIRATEEFNKMPLEVRKEFDYSAEKYVSMMGTKEFLDIMAPYNKKIADIKEAGSMKEYEKKVTAQAKFENDVAKAKGITNEQKQ